MGNFQDTYTSLIPEEYLLSNLAPLWRKRLLRTCELLQESVYQLSPPLWEDIARECAVSHYHLLRMFHLTFHETPGQYVRRLKLRGAVDALVEYQDSSVTDIALAFGFSSSQSFAKALRRELNVSARKVRQLASAGESEALEKIVLKLGHTKSDDDQCLELQMTNQLNFQIQEFGDIHLESEPLTGSWIESVFTCYRKRMKGKAGELVLITPISEIEKSADYQAARIGLQVSANMANQKLQSKQYLCCNINVGNDSAYIAAWDALYSFLLKEGLELDNVGYVVEFIECPANLSMDTCKNLKMKLCLPVTS